MKWLAVSQDLLMTIVLHRLSINSHSRVWVTAQESERNLGSIITHKLFWRCNPCSAIFFIGIQKILFDDGAQ